MSLYTALQSYLETVVFARALSTSGGPVEKIYSRRINQDAGGIEGVIEDGQIERFPCCVISYPVDEVLLMGGQELAGQGCHITSDPIRYEAMFLSAATNATGANSAQLQFAGAVRDFIVGNVAGYLPAVDALAESFPTHTPRVRIVRVSSLRSVYRSDRASVVVGFTVEVDQRREAFDGS